MGRPDIVRSRGHGWWQNCVKEDLRISRLMNGEKIYGFTQERHCRSGNDPKRHEWWTPSKSRGKSRDKCNAVVQSSLIEQPILRLIYCDPSCRRARGSGTIGTVENVRCMDSFARYWKVLCKGIPTTTIHIHLHNV